MNQGYRLQADNLLASAYVVKTFAEAYLLATAV